MKDAIFFVAALLGLFIVLPFLILWARDRFVCRRLSPAETEAQSRRFEDRLRSPDLNAVENHFGHALPAPLRALYGDPQELTRSDFEMLPPDDSAPVYICFYNPADAADLDCAWPGCEGYFAFADDGAGNELLVDPRQEDPPVLRHDHETGELRTVAATLSAFMNWKRRSVEE